MGRVIVRAGEEQPANRGVSPLREIARVGTDGTTLILRDAGPEAHAADGQAPPPAPPVAGDAGGHPRARAVCAPDRRHQRRWVPITMGWLCLLIGLADII